MSWLNVRLTLPMETTLRVKRDQLEPYLAAQGVDVIELRRTAKRMPGKKIQLPLRRPDGTQALLEIPNVWKAT